VSFPHCGSFPVIVPLFDMSSKDENKKDSGIKDSKIQLWNELKTAKSSNMKEFVEKLTKISSANTENKLDDKMERYSKWIADQEIDGTTFCAKILTNEDSFIRWAAPELVKGPATVLYNALAEFLKGAGIHPAESAGGGQGAGAEENTKLLLRIIANQEQDDYEYYSYSGIDEAKFDRLLRLTGIIESVGKADLSNLKTCVWPGFGWKKNVGEASQADEYLLEMSQQFAVTEELKKTPKDLFVIANGNSKKGIFSFSTGKSQITGQPDVLIMKNSGLEDGNKVVVIFELAHSNKWIDTHAKKMRQAKALLIGAQRYHTTEKPVLICSDLNENWYLIWLSNREDQKGPTSSSSSSPPLGVFAPLRSSPSLLSMPPPPALLPPELVTIKTQQIPKDKVIELVRAILSGNRDPVQDRVRLNYNLLPAQTIKKKPKRKRESQTGDDSKSDRDSESDIQDSPKKKDDPVKKSFRDPDSDIQDSPKAKASRGRGRRSGRPPMKIDRGLRSGKKVSAIQVLFHCSPNHEDHPSLAHYREYYGDLAFRKLQEALMIE